MNIFCHYPRRILCPRHEQKMDTDLHRYDGGLCRHTDGLTRHVAVGRTQKAYRMNKKWIMNTDLYLV